jgi:hypothetical protein
VSKLTLSAPDEYWTTEYMIDYLKQHLAKVKQPVSNNEGKTVEVRKYYNQAFHFQKIGAFKPAPSFIVYLSDLTPKIIKELSTLDSQTRDYVLRQAVGRIFEDVNSDLYHNSISRVLKVKLEK